MTKSRNRRSFTKGNQISRDTVEGSPSNARDRNETPQTQEKMTFTELLKMAGMHEKGKHSVFETQVAEKSPRLEKVKDNDSETRAPLYL